MMFCFTLALEEEQENKLEELYNRYHLDLIRFAHSIVKSSEEAEDIVQRRLSVYSATSLK